VSGLSDEWSYPVVKRLLANHGKVWIFSVECGELTTYQVERDDRCWQFNLLSSARAKYEGEVSKLPHRNMAAWSERRVLDDPGASETPEGAT
jgi:hypothetical protein